MVLAGVLRPVPRDTATTRSVWGLSAADAAARATAPVYLRAYGVRVVATQPTPGRLVFPSRAGAPARPR